MTILDKWFSLKGSKAPETHTEVTKEAEPEVVSKENFRRPKSIEDVNQARSDIFALEDKRQEALTKIREEKQVVKAVGVNEFERNSSKRTKTFADLINPLEKELQDISQEITELRKEFDLQPSRVSVLTKRLQRLTDLKELEERIFSTTETGQKIKNFKDQIKSLEQKKNAFLGEHPSPMELENTVVKDLAKEISDLESKIQRLYREDKDGNKYANQIDLINTLTVDTSSMLRSAKDASMDENGHLRIK